MQALSGLKHNFNSQPEQTQRNKIGTATGTATYLGARGYAERRTKSFEVGTVWEQRQIFKINE